jgi:hypothetical protein
MVKLKIIATCFVLIFLLDGCLVVSHRIFTYSVRKDGKVELQIKYIDIRSAYTTNGLEPDTGFVEKDEEPALSEEVKDYNALIQDFYVSNYFSNCYKSGKVISRKLYEENGLLNGEVKIEFQNIKDAGITKVKRDYALISDSICGFIPFVDSIIKSTDFEITLAEESQSQKISWKKKSGPLVFEIVPYFPYSNSVSLLEQWKKDK